MTKIATKQAKTAQPKDRHFVESLARGLEILSAFRAGDRFLGNSEFVERTNLPKSTVARLTRTLVALNYLQYEPRIEKYRLGTAVLGLGYALLSDLEITRVAMPLMNELAQYGEVNVGLAAALGTEMIYLDTALGGGNTVYKLWTGNRVEIESTAIGQAYFSALPASEQKALLTEIKKQRPSQFPAAERKLDQAAKDIKRRGFCIAEWQSDVVAAGVALVDANGKCEFAFNCGAPKFLLTQERLIEDLGPRLVNLANNVRRNYTDPFK